MATQKLIAACLLMIAPLGAIVLGCSSKTDNTAASDQQATLADTDSATQGKAATGESAPAAPASSAEPSDSMPTPDDNDALLANELFSPAESNLKDDQGSAADAGMTPLPSASSNAKQLQLRSNLAPSQLTEFLKLADLEMQNIVSGRAGVHDQREAIEELVRVGKMKLQASEQLAASSDATEAQKSLGLRGQLQSLSHLAAQGDLPSAERLESLASEWIKSADASVVEDCRLVLIGLELEKLQNGSSKDPANVLKLLRDLESGDQTHDIAALMVMGQSKHVLDEYGFADASKVVREQVSRLFGSHPDPNVASIASQIAGPNSFAAVEQQLNRLVKNEAVTIEEWNNAVGQVLAGSHDMVTVHFLASAAAQAESLGRFDLVESTFKLMGDVEAFAEPERKEAETIYRAYLARRDLIGKTMEIELSSVDGAPIEMADYLGQIVLMPFWTVGIPDSLTQLQRLNQLRETNAGKVEIVGINLDRTLVEGKDFESQSPVEFRSFATEDQFDSNGKNAIAQKFGVVSVPYVIVVDAEGKIIGYDFTGQQLDNFLQKALK